MRFETSMTAGAGVDKTPTIRLAADFETPGREQWLDLVEKAINGASFEKKLVSRTADGLRLEPIYTRFDSPAAARTLPPGTAPFTRGVETAVKGLGWEIHQLVAAGDPAEANATVLAELEGGANGIVLQLEAPGQFGVRVKSVADMAEALAGMRVDLAPVSLKAGLEWATGAHYLLAALREIGKTGTAHAFLNIDPIGALARWGTLTDPLDEALAGAMALAKEARGKGPGIRSVCVDATIYHEAGASEAQELAALAATFVAYLRTFEAAGVTPADAMSHLSFALAADADQFMTVAKLRAARRLVWRIAEASGAGTRAPQMHIAAGTSERMMAKRDPWTNMLRTTLACAGAALGGAQAITVLPFTWAIGAPDAFARRIARNIQIVLQEESALGRVLDPMGGSWYIEELTDKLADKAWSLFQAIEAKGGIVDALGSGFVQSEIAATAAARAEAVATGRAELTGVSAFPLLADDGVTAEPHPAAPIIKARHLVPPLTPCRSAEPFEALRDAAEAHAARAERPLEVFLASLGAVIDHTARSTWIKNYLAAGGIQSLMSDGYKNATEAAAAFSASGAKAACICSTDANYVVHGEETASALKLAGARLVLMAGRPGEREAALRSAGVDQFLFAGQDAVEVLAGLQEKLR
jgi:methylmalonyl-CoA mutase